MSSFFAWLDELPKVFGVGVISAGLVVVILTLNLFSDSALKLSAISNAGRVFLFWQIVSNTTGFMSTLADTWLLRYVPISVAHPVVSGLSLLLLQIVAARWFFGETITPTQWAGTFLVVGGIILITRA